MEFDHIGIFVKELNVGRKYLSELLLVTNYSKVYEDPLLRVRVQFGLDTSGTRYELVAPFGENNPVDGALKSGKNILNHVAYRVPDLTERSQDLVNAGGRILTQPTPAVAFGGARVVFIFTPLEFIVELIEKDAS